MEIKIEVQAKDLSKKGKGGRWHKSGSLVKQFIVHMLGQMSQTPQLIKNVLGVDVNQAAATVVFSAVAAAGITGQGIVVGTGNNPVTSTDYKLQTQLTVNFAYGVMNFAIDSPVPETWRVTLSRSFTNNTGAPVTIREIGVYTDLAGSVDDAMIDRTIVGILFAAGQAKTISWRLSVTV